MSARQCPECYQITWTRPTGPCLICKPRTPEEEREHAEKIKRQEEEERRARHQWPLVG